MKNSKLSLIALALFFAYSLLSTSQASAFSTLNFGRNTVLANRYTSIVQEYHKKYQEKNIIISGRISLLERRISLSFIRLTRAKTSSQKKLYEAMILRNIKTLDAEIAKFKAVQVSQSKTDQIPEIKPTPAILSVPKFIGDTPTWDGVDTADFLYYADAFEGANTSNGNIFHQSGFSAARCNVPLNTFLQLRYADAGVLVKVNDRPNCSKHPDIVDLTRSAFATLGPISRGRLAGSFNVLDTVHNEIVKEYLPVDFFSAVGVQLDSRIPNLYLPNETLRITGITTNNATESLIYIITPSGKKISYGQDAIANTRFEYLYPLDEMGDYQFVVASGNSFSGVRSLGFTVLDPRVLQNKQYFGSAPTATVSSISTERREAGDLTASHVVTLNGIPNTLYRGLTIESNGKKVSRTSMGNIVFLPNELKNFTVGNEAMITITGRTSSTLFSQDTYTTATSMYAKQMTLGPLYKAEHNTPFRSWINENQVNFILTEESSQKISGTAYVITPSGKVDKVLFGSDRIGNKGSLNVSKNANFSYQMKEKGVYLVEVNFDTGFAAIIEPIIYGNVLAILPNEYDFSNRTLEMSTNGAILQTFASINAIRKKAGISEVTLDPTLTQVAQFKAQDMADNNYVGHIDSEGVYIRDTAKRAGIILEKSIGENVAGGTVSASFLQAGLSLSGGHRANMLGDWTKVGIGIVISGGKVHLSEVFSD